MNHIKVWGLWLCLALSACAPGAPSYSYQNFSSPDEMFLLKVENIENYAQVGISTRQDIISHYGRPTNIYQYTDERTKFIYSYIYQEEESKKIEKKLWIPLYSTFNQKDAEKAFMRKQKELIFVFLPNKKLESYTLVTKDLDYSEEGIKKQQIEKLNEKMHFYEQDLDTKALTASLHIGKTTKRDILLNTLLGEPDDIENEVWIYRFAPKTTEEAIAAARFSYSMREGQTAFQQSFSKAPGNVAMIGAIAQGVMGLAGTLSSTMSSYPPPTPFHLEFDADDVLTTFYFVNWGALYPDEEDLLQKGAPRAAVQAQEQS